MKKVQKLESTLEKKKYQQLSLQIANFESQDAIPVPELGDLWTNSRL